MIFILLLLQIKANQFHTAMKILRQVFYTIVGLVPTGEAFAGVQAVNASGAENASGAQISFQPRVTYTCPGVPQMQGIKTVKC